MLNKLRLIKIYELRGKVHPIEAYIIDILDGIEKDYTESYEYYMKNDIVYLRLDRKREFVWFSDIIYNYYHTRFRCSYVEIDDIIYYLVEKHLK